MATGGNEIASDEIPDFPCISCDNRTVVKYCVDCQGYCCQSCVDIHSRFPTMKGHILLEDPSSAGSKHAKLPLVLTVKCDIHSFKVLDMYCSDHDVMCCTTCQALDHRSCNNVHSIPDDVDLLFNTSEIKEVSQKLRKDKETLENIAEEKDELLEGLLASKEEADNMIKNSKMKIIDAVEEMEKQSLEEVDNLCQQKKMSIEKEKKQARDMAVSIGKLFDRLTARQGNNAQQFVYLKIGKKKIKHVKEFESSLAEEKEAKINFTIDPDFQNCFRNMTFGKTSIKSSLKEKTNLYKVEKCVDMNVRLSQDSTFCHITGSCFNEGGSLLIVDSNNKKLKRANLDTVTINAFCNFDVCPYSVCCTSREEAVVTFYTNAKYIQFVTLGSQLTPSRKVKIGHNCLGITCKNDKLYITDRCQSVYIHGMNGEQLQVVSPYDKSGNCLFKKTRSTTFSNTTRNLIVGDWDNGVIILDEAFQRVASFNNYLVDTNAVCTDNRGNIFVCGALSNNVLQIGYDGQERGVIAGRSSRLHHPRSVCFDSSQCKLIVTQLNDTVKIFQLK